MDFLSMLSSTAAGAGDICGNIKPVMMVVGYVILGIKIIVPIVLIIVGMIDMAKAVAGKDEDVIKKAQQGLIKKAIAAVVVFLVATLVGMIMGLVGSDAWKACKDCINTPWSADCALGSTVIS